MENPRPVLVKLYDRLILQRPLLVIAVLLAVYGFFGYKIKDFKLDASEDSLVLEHDPDLKFHRLIGNRYGTEDYLVLAYTPNAPLLDRKTLEMIGSLRNDLKALPMVKSVTTLLDVPLLKSPPVDLKELKENPRTLESDDADLKLAEQELRTNPTFADLLVSADLKTAGILINLKQDEEHHQLQTRKGELLDKELDGTFTAADARELAQVKKAYQDASQRLNVEKHELIAKIRKIKESYSETGRMHLGGISMISDDMVSFIQNDLKIFGTGMLLFLIVTLWVIFRRKRWIILPMVCCLLSVVAMMGILGLVGWQVTVISSNFISLQLIVTMALAIHLIVRYSELLNAHPDRDNRTLILDTVQTIFIPCLYTSLTTVAGFSSLIFSDILPVINFGWMMSLGLCVSLLTTFLLFPAILILIPKANHRKAGRFGFPVTSFFARVTEKRGPFILFATLVVAILTSIGIARLKVENSFIDYFRETTEIYRGMKAVDQKLGGTTPLELVLRFKPDTAPAPAPKTKASDDDDTFDEFDEFSEFNEGESDEKYWFTMAKMRTISDVHDYLESLPAIGKVLSLKTMLTVAEDFNDGEELDNFSLGVTFNSLSDDYKALLVDPYVSIENDEARLNMRIIDSLPKLERDALLKQIATDLEKKFGLKPEVDFKLGGIMVLYNNMLQSLFKSQIQTIGFTVLALFVMFLILFRSALIALIALFPNVLASVVVLGVMGLSGIPLDMMTITIVAISIGIAVDNTIHYIHRFRHEFQTDGKYLPTMHRCHGSIGNAMYYTSITIIIGFSILSLSNFIPSVLFGLLTGVAMVMALLAALTLLPRLIILVKPFGKERAEG